MICRSAGCGGPARPYRYSIGRREVPFCDDCAAGAIALGVDMRAVERRVTDIPVGRDRRIRRPAWLRHLTARDRTGAVVPA